MRTGWENLADVFMNIGSQYREIKESRYGQQKDLEKLRMQLLAQAEEARRNRDFQGEQNALDRLNRLEVAKHPAVVIHGKDLWEKERIEEESLDAKKAHIRQEAERIWRDSITPLLAASDAPYDLLNEMLLDNHFIGKRLPVKAEEWDRLDKASKDALLNRFLRREIGDELSAYAKEIGLDKTTVINELGYDYFTDVNWKEWFKSNRKSIIETERGEDIYGDKIKEPRMSGLEGLEEAGPTLRGQPGGFTEGAREKATKGFDLQKALEEYYRKKKQ